MSEPREPVCFQCGHPVSAPPQVHDLPSGDPCPQCQDRYLDSLPSLLPSPGLEVRAEDEEEVDARLGPRPIEETYPDEPHPA